MDTLFDTLTERLPELPGDASATEFPRQSIAREIPDCLETLNPKVQGSISCASTDLLCPQSVRTCLWCTCRAKWWLAECAQLFVDSLRIWKTAPDRRRVRPDLNSVGSLLPELSCIAANQESPGCHQDVRQVAIAIS